MIYTENKEEELIEEWREYNGYKISNYGKIIGKKGKLLSTKIAKDGYVPTGIIDYGGKKIHGLHRVIATIFIPNPNNLPEVNHIDGVKHNNRVDNLEWVTKSENQLHEVRVLQQRNGEKNCKNKLKEEQVIEIYNLCKEGKMKYKDIAELYNIEACQVSLIVSGDKWKYLNLEPLPRLIRGARGRSKQIIWINENKEYISMTKCSEDLKDTYGIIISSKMIKRICEGEFSEKKGQQFKYIQTQ